MSIRTTASILALTVMLSGCAKADMGAVLGAGAGAVVGAQFGAGAGQIAATAIGTLVGAMLGREAGASMDRADAAYARSGQFQGGYSPSSDTAAAQQAVIAALNGTGVWQQVYWANPYSKAHGWASAGVKQFTADGQECREFNLFSEQTTWGNTQNRTSSGYACKPIQGGMWTGWLKN